MIIMCQCRFISCRKCITLVGVFIMGEAMNAGEQGVYGKSLKLPLSFAVNLKVLYKIKL